VKRSLHLGLGALLLVALFLGSVLDSRGSLASAAAPTAAPTPRPSILPAPTIAPGLSQPTPFPDYTLGPASVSTSMPFPAYGSPVPGVGQGPPPSAAPQIITLPQAIAIAFARSPSLASARADTGIANASKRLAQTGYYPSISGSLTTQRSNRQPGGGTIGAGGNTISSVSSTTSNSLQGTLRQLIFDGGRVAASIRAASYSESASVDTYRRDLQTVAFNVATAYYNDLQAQRTTEVAVQTVQVDLVQEDLVRAQLQAGVATRVDLSTAQLPTAQARVALVKAQAAELSAQAVFANALGLDANLDIRPFDDTPVTATGAISTIPVPSYDAALVRAYALRPDLAAAEHAVQSQRESLLATRLQLFPSISGSASAGTSSTDVTGGTFRNSNSIGATMSIPIFDQGITLADIAQQKAQIEKILAQLELSRETVQLNVKQALVNLVAARAQLDQAQAEYAKANDVVHATQAQYRYGVTTLPLLLNAQVGLTTALVDQVTAVYGLRQAEQAYLYAIGANTP
jgi:outer membrane protein